MEVSGAVLAGGRGTRLGQDKALVEVGGESLLARVVGRLAQVCAEVLVVGRVTGPPLPAPARFVPDLIPGQAALGGLYTALSAAACPLVIVVACDMPFVEPTLLRFLLGLFGDGVDAVVPLVGQEPQPLHAVYSRTCAAAAATQVATGDLKVARLLQRLRVRYVAEAQLRVVDPELRSFFNINTPADLELARSLVGGWAH
ncbi:MAG: molybdenum cofactor guanylyltransferase [Chloroflexota bacterium]